MSYIEIYFRKKREQLEFLTNIKNLFLILIGTLVVCVSLILWSLYRSRIQDEMVLVNPIPQETIELAKKTKSIIKTGIYIKNFTNFDMMQGEFKWEALVWFSYDKSGPVTLDLIKDFAFEHATMDFKSEPKVSELDGKEFVQYYVILTFKQRFNFSSFPLDAHRINLVLINNSLADTDALYISDSNDVMIAPDALIRDWNLSKIFATQGLVSVRVSDDNDPVEIDYQRVVFSLEFYKNSLRSLFLIFTPLFLIFFIGLFSLTFDVMKNFSTVLSLAVGSTSALFFYLGSLEKFSPKTDIFTIADKIFVLLLIITIITLGMQIYLLHYYQSIEQRTRIPELLAQYARTINIIRSAFFILFLIVMVVSLFFLLP